MVDNDYIWYVCYGSNVNVERFYCYIHGGAWKYNNRNHYGSKIKENPIQQSTLEIPFELYFSKSAKSWENKGVAFLKSSKNNTIKTKCVAYLIRKEQFFDILLQENSRNPFDENEPGDFSMILQNQEYFLGPKNENLWYGRIINLGEFKGYSAFTFTAKWSDETIEYALPGEKYLKTIIKGIQSNFNITTDEIAGYFAGLAGIKGNLNEHEIKFIINSL